MKGRKAPQLHLTWVEQWDQGWASESLDIRELEMMTSSRVSVAVNNIHMVVSKSSGEKHFWSLHILLPGAKKFVLLVFWCVLSVLITLDQRMLGFEECFNHG